MNLGCLHNVLEHRYCDLGKTLRNAALAYTDAASNPSFPTLKNFKPLAGDSHQGGARPFLFSGDTARLVLKHADPRPYRCLAEILNRLSSGLQVDLRMPEIISSPSNDWYFVPYLTTTSRTTNQPEPFMYAVGILTAVAYALRIVDLHMENIVIHGQRPMIIDPECIFSNFAPVSTKERLLSTGLLSHNTLLSALRGGGKGNAKLFQIGLQIKNGETVSYKKPSPVFHNRIANKNGNEWDPADFRSTFMSGYIDAMRWVTKNAALVTDIIDDIASGDFRIRYLVRKTRLYSVTTHMLNIPAGELYPAWRECVYRRFASAGHFTESVSQKLLHAEFYDMDRRDIPYFWVTANDNWVLHETGAVQTTESKTTPKQQAIQDIRNLRKIEFAEHIDALDEFFDTDIRAGA